VIPKEVVERPGGNTMHGVTRKAPKVKSACRKIFETFKPCGPCNIQQMVVGKEPEVYTFEINPRFSSTTCLTVESGVNEIDILVRDAVNESVSKSIKYEADLHMLRYTNHLIVKDENL
jgi:carbamoyl-phosphate synthase large subunit